VTNIEEIEAQLRIAFQLKGSEVPDEPVVPWSEYKSVGSSRRSVTSTISSGALVNTLAHEEAHVLEQQTRPRRRHPRPKRSTVVLASIVAVAAGIVFMWLPIPDHNGSSSAAASELLQTANAAVHQSMLVPASDQALETRFDIGIEVTELGSESSPESTAEFMGTVDEWTLSNGTGEEQVSYGDPQFTSETNQQSWQPNAHLPFQGTIPYSLNGPVVQLGPPVGAFDVSSLPTNASALADTLSKALTGIKGLDSLPAGPDLVLERVSLILMSPRIGGSSQFTSALYQVLSSLPGMETQGSMTTHSGQVGTGFTETGSGETLIVNTSTGALLEVRAPATMTPPPSVGSSAFASPVGQESLLWLDPIQGEIVSANTVPTVSSGSDFG
jgi:hypothetical protein